MIIRKFVQKTHKYEGWLSDDNDMKNAKKDALLEAIEDSDAALELLNKVLLRLGDAVRKASDYGNAGDEVMPIRDILNKIRPIYRELKYNINNLEKEVNGSFSELAIEEIDGDAYYIEEYDGKETVVTPYDLCWTVIP